MIVNVTNSKAISKVAGSSYIEDWRGVSVSLYTTEVNAFGEVVEAVRIRQTAPKITKPTLSPDHPKWSEAVAAIQSGSTTIAKVRGHYTLSSDNARTLQAEAEVSPSLNLDS